MQLQRQFVGSCVWLSAKRIHGRFLIQKRFQNMYQLRQVSASQNLYHAHQMQHQFDGTPHHSLKILGLIPCRMVGLPSMFAAPVIPGRTNKSVILLSFACSGEERQRPRNEFKSKRLRLTGVDTLERCLKCRGIVAPDNTRLLYHLGKGSFVLLGHDVGRVHLGHHRTLRHHSILGNHTTLGHHTTLSLRHAHYAYHIIILHLQIV
mmetsp:Transcript_92929/g.150039  ORF Transcript_92929/g.150039 Transcript_92929/m.150039 type:complete len:206 (-) Transcript_92929:282-899(-)